MSDGNEADILLSADQDTGQFFRSLHGRKMAALSETYPLPVDSDEEERQGHHHRQMKFIFSGKNYIGPVKEALQFGDKRRILDLGTGKGYWAIDMADEFPRADVIGVDIAPIQPEYVPPNCQFEICNLDEPNELPYDEESFDFIHARSIHIGIQDYPGLVAEIGRLLKPGGLVLLIEPDLFPVQTADTTGDPRRGTASPDPGAGLPQYPGPQASSGPANASSGSGSVTGHDNLGHGAGQPVMPTGLAQATSPTGSNSAGVTHLQARAGTSAAVASGSGASHLAARSPPHSPQTQGVNIGTVPHPQPAAPFSLSPTRRGPTTNRRHLDFILNHGPESPRPSPQPAFVQPPHEPHPTSPRAQSPLAGPSTAVDDPVAPPTTMPGWFKLWATFRTCLAKQPRAVDVTVPSQLGEILAASGSFERITVKQANVPVGFWPQDETMLTIGQLQWSDYELLIPALKPFFYSMEISPNEVAQIVQEAQHDLYHPSVPFLTHIHIAYATKRRN